MRILRWQLGSRLLGSRVVVPFVDGSWLLVGTGMHGATGNVYVGLMEFEDMAFVLHLVCEGDEFLDVGANMGVYSILAATRGARMGAVSHEKIQGHTPEKWAEDFERIVDFLFGKSK